MSALPRTATAIADFGKPSCLLYPESGRVRCVCGVKISPGTQIKIICAEFRRFPRLATCSTRFFPICCVVCRCFGPHQQPQDNCNDLCPFRSPNRIRLPRLLTIAVELRATLRNAIPEKRSGYHDGTYDRRGSCIRLDRIAVGIHDFRSLATVRQPPNTGYPGGKRCQHGP